MGFLPLRFQDENDEMLGRGKPVDGDGGTDGKVGDNHDTGVEEDEGLGCNLRSRIISIEARPHSVSTSPLS